MLLTEAGDHTRSGDHARAGAHAGVDHPPPPPDHHCQAVSCGDQELPGTSYSYPQVIPFIMLANCRHQKNLPVKALRQVFICLWPPPLL